MFRTLPLAVAVLLAATMLTTAASPARADDSVTVSGTVVDPAGEPVAGAEIWDGARASGPDSFYGYCVDRSGDVPLAVTDDAGSYRFTCSVSSSLAFYAIAPDGDHANGSGYLGSPGTYSDRVLRLEPLPESTVRLSGVVRDPDGTPMSGVEVWDEESVLGNQSGGECVEVGRVEEPLAVSGPDGHYQLSCRTTEAVQIRAHRPSGTPFDRHSALIWFRSREAVYQHDIHFFRELGSLTGRVLRQDGSPAPGVWVVLWGNCNVDCDSVQTDADGRFVMTGLVPWAPYSLAYTGAVGADRHIIATEGTLTVPDVSIVDRAPRVAVERSDRPRKLAVHGIARDDLRLLKVRVAVRDLDTGRWLRARGRWGDYQLLPAELAEPGASYSEWRFVRGLDPGRYGVSVVAIDDALQRTPAPRPWLVVRVRR